MYYKKYSNFQCILYSRLCLLLDIITEERYFFYKHIKCIEREREGEYDTVKPRKFF